MGCRVPEGGNSCPEAQNIRMCWCNVKCVLKAGTYECVCLCVCVCVYVVVCRMGVHVCLGVSVGGVCERERGRKETGSKSTASESLKNRTLWNWEKMSNT